MRLRFRPGMKVYSQPEMWDLDRPYVIRPAGWLAWLADVYYDARARWKR